MDQLSSVMIMRLRIGGYVGIQSGLIKSIERSSTSVSLVQRLRPMRFWFTRCGL